ncbi:FAD-dependent oxidoreductase [Halanaerobium saccharolyticum]|uniref:FAD dependent oxidoreductase n=1 Tax=Halanaerobium saccharolyticum TaxID=43595 RepID=A0A4V3CZI6_9FIRM|nr:FAD-dependent oxidoreductase [Halanaerobium saccharolyticum]TDP98208.1 FAD dependent oxidoreductase [Halanaerobium saccharolyticum]
MKTIKFNSKEIKLNNDYQLIIIGGGTAGATAAIAAARMEVKTLIVEKESALGGSSTLGQVTPMMPVKIEGNPNSSAINKEIKSRLKVENAGAEDSSNNDGWFNPEKLKFVLEELYLEAGGDILYESTFVDSQTSEEKIENIIIKNKSGLTAYQADYYLDCSGDAELAFSASVPMQEDKGEDYQAVSLRFTMDNIDLKKFNDFLEAKGQSRGLEYPLVETAYTGDQNSVLANLFKDAVNKGILRKEDLNYFQIFSIPGQSGKMAFNCPEIPFKVDPLDASQRTEAYIEGRKIIKRLIAFSREYFPGFEQAQLASQAELLGVRESRRIKGEYTFGLKDYQERRKFDDAVASSAYPLDVHGQELKLDKLEGGEYYQLPFRSLIPQKVTNLLVAGRHISATFSGQSAVRIQPIVMATGEAAALAVAIAVKEKKNLKEINGKEIKKIMLDWGADI